MRPIIIIGLGLLFLAAQFVTYYVALFVLVILPILLTGSDCRINPNTTLCTYLGSPIYVKSVNIVSYILAFIPVFLIYLKIKSSNKKLDTS